MATVTPVVSVVVPNYNHARYLPRRLESIFAQTFSDFEVIILDDGSTDDSRTVIAEYLGHPGVRVEMSETNSGSPFAQWNRGVALARGEFVWIAESDDFAEPEFLATLLPTLRRHPNVGLVYCQSSVADEDGNGGGVTRYGYLHDNARWTHDHGNTGPDECVGYLLWEITIPNASAVLFRRSIYLAAGGAPGDMRLCGDWMTWVRMLTRSDVQFIARPLNHFRHHRTSVSVTTPAWRYVQERLRVQAYVIRYAPVSREDRRSAAIGSLYLLARLLRQRPGQAWRDVPRVLPSLFELHRHCSASTTLFVSERLFRRLWIRARDSLIRHSG
jgi:glycosyltransferase involved in cell wall biosynthesis